MRIVFFGTPELAVPSLAALAEQFAVTALVCRPDKAQGRSKKLVAPPTKVWAEAQGVPVHQPTKLNDGTFEEWLREQAPDVCALVAYGRILKQPILDVPSKGFLNVHPSRLPKYRGPAPIQGALLDGLEETAVTIMRLDAGMDTGDMLIQQPLAIAPHDNAETLTQKAGALGAELLVDAVRRVESGEARFEAQNDEDATYTQLLRKVDGRIDWTRSARDLHNLVRAATPWPGAQCSLRGKPIRILGTEVLEARSAASPGEIVHADKASIHVATGDGLLALRELQTAGKRAMTVSEFQNGARLEPGDRFEGVH